MTTFRIDDSFNITNRGLVIVGELLNGRIKNNDTLKFKGGSSEISLKIKSIESVDNISEKVSKTGLLFHYESEEHRLQIANLKVASQIAFIEHL